MTPCSSQPVAAPSGQRPEVTFTDDNRPGRVRRDCDRRTVTALPKAGRPPHAGGNTGWLGVRYQQPRRRRVPDGTAIGNDFHYWVVTRRMSRSTLRPVIKLRSTAGTGYTYVTRKSRRNDPDRLVIRKYDPVIGRHVEFREER